MTTRARKRQRRLEATTPLLLPLAARLTASFLGARDVARLALASRGVRAALRGAPLDLGDIRVIPSELHAYFGSGQWRLVGVTLDCAGGAVVEGDHLHVKLVRLELTGATALPPLDLSALHTLTVSIEIHKSTSMAQVRVRNR